MGPDSFSVSIMPQSFVLGILTGKQLLHRLLEGVIVYTGQVSEVYCDPPVATLNAILLLDLCAAVAVLVLLTRLSGQALCIGQVSLCLG